MHLKHRITLSFLCNESTFKRHKYK